MESFCGSIFWDSQLTWNTTNPELTPCFEKTVLVWLPCVFLWLFAPLETSIILRSKNRDIPWSWVNISKLVCSLLLLVDGFTLLVSYLFVNDDKQLYGADYLAPSLILLTLVLQILFVYFAKKRGIVKSGVLFIFWMLMLLCFMPAFRTHIWNVTRDEEDHNMTNFVIYMIFYSLVCVMFILNCFGDKKPNYMAHQTGLKPCPDTTASFLSVITFSWLNSLVWAGYRKPLVQNDLFDLSYNHSSKKIVDKWEENWEINLQKTYNKGKSKTRTTHVDGTSQIQIIGTAPNEAHYVSILPTLVRTFGPEFLFGGLLKLCSDCLQFVSPMVLSLLITFTENEDAEAWKGYLYAVLLLVNTTLQSVFLGQYFVRMFEIGLKVRTAIVAAVYKKALKISNAARKESTVGEIVNLMSVDAQRFMDLTTYLNMLWSAPMQIFLALYFLWGILGPSTLAGLAVLIILIPVNGFIANEVKKLQIKQMKEKDKRVKMMNEILNGIKVLKLYAWETSFQDQVLEVREREINVLKKAAYLNAGTTFIWTCAPFMVSLASFATFSIIGNKPLDAKLAFVSLALFNLLRFPVSMLPMLVSNLIQASVSLKRMNKFMNAEELNPNAVNQGGGRRSNISIDNGSFSWDAAEDKNPTLQDINMTIKEGSLVGVVGKVGAGKSSLCSAMIGEMDKIGGLVNVNGSVAYVAQQAWIQNNTLEDNILFGKELNPAYYRKVVHACALQPDIAMLSGGDQTEIGEKGINLSGGQKQRVSLARAVYSDSNIYILDDPLSAVDSHVGRHIFEKIISSNGLLKDKTRILVTHGLTYLRHMDHIIVMKNGTITEQGTYEELLANKGEFQEFLLQYLSKTDNDSADNEGIPAALEEIKFELEQRIGHEEFARQISRTRINGDTRLDSNSQLANTTVSKNSNKSPNGQVHAENEPSDRRKLIEEEKSETGRVSFSVYGYYIRAIGVAATIVTIFFYAASQGFSVGSNLWLSKWSEDTTSNETSVRNMYLGVYGVLGLAQAFTTLFGALITYYGAFRAGKLLHNDLLTRILQLPMEFFDSNPIGRILNRFSKDVDTIDNILPWNGRMFYLCFTSVIATLAVITYTTPMFSIVMLPCMGLYYFIQVMYVSTSRQLKRIESISRSPIYSHFGETVQGAATIRAFNKVDEFILHSKNKVDFNQRSYFPSIIANRWLAIRLEFLGNILTFSAALFAVMSKGHISAGEVGLSIAYALQVTQTLNWLVRMSSDVETNIVSVERIKEYAETEPEAPWEIPQNKPPKDWPQEGAIQFSNYSTRYREGLDLVVKGVDFEIKPAEKIGIVGRTGAGKSSLTLGLFRILEPAGGTIFVDGVDVSKMGLHDLRSRLTIIPQDPVLFSGILRLNLDPFGVYSDEKLWKALEDAHLKNFVTNYTHGLHHEITEGGENLSVGQRQLVCLARALLRKTKVLILDEATAAVDMETDDLIQRTIRREFKDCTVLTIAHRLNTIMDVTRVLVLDKGEVKEFDTPSNLLKNQNSIFYSMAKNAGLL